MPFSSPVIQSTIVEQSVQVDGRIAVREEHVANGGETASVSYLAESGADLDAAMAVHAQQFLERLASA